MPKFKYDGHMPSQETSKKQPPSILRQVLEALAIHFGWDNWSHYHRNNYDHAVKLKQTVYDLPHSEKIVILNNCKDNR